MNQNMATNGGTKTAPPPTPAQGSEPPLATLISGIVTDGQKLISQHISLLHQELQEDLSKTRTAAYTLGSAIGLGTLALSLLVVMLIGALHYAMPEIPWWGLCGIVGGVLAVAAIGLWYTGTVKLSTLNPMPEQTAQAIEDNATKIANRLT